MVAVAAGMSATDDGDGNGVWGDGAFISGRLKGVERWRMPLDQAAASLQGPTYDRTPLRYADIGNSMEAVDELAFVATPPSHRLHTQTSESRKAVLLRGAVVGGLGSSQ